MRPPPRGFTYLVLLFGLAIGGAGLAALGTQWQLAAQRERETELLFRGLQLRDALQRFHDQTPDGQPALPQTLEQLLTDARRPAPRHHLRQLYADPFTGQADWVLLRATDGGITGLHSSASRPLLRRHGLPDGVIAQAPAQPGDSPPLAAALAARASDWHFSIAVRHTPNRPSP
ncbi:MAG: type II secretion system protein [Aquabacterium sp.]|nr:type II secretion system protein [Aquabacterium sp.]